MRVLAVNAGSTSLKRHLVDGEETIVVDGGSTPTPSAIASSTAASGSGAPVEIDDEVESAIAELASIAPLHNTPALSAIREARRALDGIPHVAVFDTAFHATIPDRASTYAIPAQWREWGIRRYGFHGLSVDWVAGKCPCRGSSSVTSAAAAPSPLCWTAVRSTRRWASRPLEGVPMATRSGRRPRRVALPAP